MGTLDELRALLERDKGSWPETAKAAQVDRNWIAKFMSGDIAEPGFGKVDRLHTYLKAKYQVSAEAA